MEKEVIPRYIAKVNEERLSHDLFYLSKYPLPYRKLNAVRPGQTKNTLYEADDFIESRLRSLGYKVEKEAVQVQAFRCDCSKPKSQWFSQPDPSDPWYTAYNIYAKKKGKTRPDEIIVAISHKDSQSWIDSPGAYDNAVGTVGNLEIARLLTNFSCDRSIWFIFCNEEHTPWTSVTAAQNARFRGDNIVSVFNLDGLGGKSQKEVQNGRCTNVTLYTTPEGKRLADLMAEVNTTYRIGLVQTSYQREFPNDDDGSFIKAGYSAAVANIGSFPYADPNYHSETDIPEFVDCHNVCLSVQASLAAILKVNKSQHLPFLST